MDECVLIVSPSGDLHAMAVAEALRRDHRIAVHRLDMQCFPESARLTFSCIQGREKRRWINSTENLDFENVRSVWWRRPQPPAVPRLFTGVDHGQFMQTESEHFLQGLLWSKRCLWVNDPMNNLRASRKVVQLSKAVEHGLAVPATLITNDAQEARAFLRSLQGRVIFKRTGSGPGPASKTSFVTADVLERIDAIADCPTTFQEYIEARCDIRAVWIAGELWPISIDSQAGLSPEDCRFDNSVDFQPCELPVHVRDGLARLMNDLGLIFGAIDLRLGLDGEYYFLEVNPAGQFAYLEAKTGTPLISAVASLLAAGKSSAPWA